MDLKAFLIIFSIGSIAGVIIGIILVILGIIGSRRYKHLEEVCTHEVMGYVSEIIVNKHIEYKSKYNARTEYRYTPVIKYLDTYSIKGMTTENLMYKEGSEVLIRYNLKDPKEAVIANEHDQSKIGNTIIIIVGMFITIFSMMFPLPLLFMHP